MPYLFVTHNRNKLHNTSIRTFSVLTGAFRYLDNLRIERRQKIEQVIEQYGNSNLYWRNRLASMDSLSGFWTSTPGLKLYQTFSDRDPLLLKSDFLLPLMREWEEL